MVWIGRFVPKCEMRKEALKRPYDLPIVSDEVQAKAAVEGPCYDSHR